MSLEETIEKLVDAKIAKASQGPQTVLAEYKGLDSQGKGWVVISGSTEATPISRAVVEANPGDTVSVTVGNGQAVMDANISNPSAGVVGVRKAAQTAQEAKGDAEQAIAYSSRAMQAANNAQESADSAGRAASRAWEHADSAGLAASAAQESADNAATAAGNAQTSADNAQASANNAATAASVADEKAVAAAQAANTANTYALAAGNRLSDVESVVGTLNWIAEHGRYVNQAGQAFDAGKVYYTRSGTAPDYTYTVVAQPVAADIASYYLLVVDESVQNFLASHIWMDNYGLNLSVDSASQSAWRIHQGTVDGSHELGFYIIDSNGVNALSISAGSISFDTNRGFVIGDTSAGSTNYIAFVPNQGIAIGGSVSISGRKTLSEVMSEIEQASQDSTTALQTANDVPIVSITSTNGTVFKRNLGVDTTLIATIFTPAGRISDATELHRRFGANAYLEWGWRDSATGAEHVIVSTDPRIGQNGFTFTVSPEDIDVQAIITCSLNY